MGTIWDYRVRLYGDDVSLTVTITEDRNDLDHDDMVKVAEQRLCELWGTTKVPECYYLADVDVLETHI
jgi:hypothetical protein